MVQMLFTKDSKPRSISCVEHIETNAGRPAGAGMAGMAVPTQF